MDLSGLSDDQLLQLIKSAMSETTRRGEAIIYAADRFVNDAAQELRTKAAKASAAGQTTVATGCSNDLAEKAALVYALIESDFFAAYHHDQFAINMWEKRGELRVYIQQSFIDDPWKFTYFHTGNTWSRAGTMDSADKSTATALIPFCQAICKRHLPGFKCYSNDYKKATPDPQALAFYRQAINKTKVSI